MSDDIRDEQLSRLYREVADAEPPAALDATILAASRAEVTPPRRRAGWRSWTVPMGVAATVMLTATLTLMVQQEKERPATEAAPAQSAPATTPQKKPDAAADLAAKPAAPLPEAKREAVRREAERAAPAPAPVPETAAPAGAVAPRAPMAESAESAAPARPAAAMRQQAAPAADAVEMRAKSAPLHKEAVGAALARTPGQWLEDIRQLKQQGKEKEAAEALAEFRKAYPDYKLPDDLR
jgi:cytoskeletal protein RodZ